MKPQTVHHTLEPLFDENSRVLILGTMPSPKSREAGFYYYHPQNRAGGAFAGDDRRPPGALPAAGDCPVGCARVV